MSWFCRVFTDNPGAVLADPGVGDRLDDVLEQRLVGDRHHRLRSVMGKRFEPSAFAGGEDDGLHGPIDFYSM